MIYSCRHLFYQGSAIELQNVQSENALRVGWAERRVVTFICTE